MYFHFTPQIFSRYSLNPARLFRVAYVKPDFMMLCPFSFMFFPFTQFIWPEETVLQFFVFHSFPITQVFPAKAGSRFFDDIIKRTCLMLKGNYRQIKCYRRLRKRLFYNCWIFKRLRLLTACHIIKQPPRLVSFHVFFAGASIYWIKYDKNDGGNIFKPDINGPYNHRKWNIWKW